MKTFARVAWMTSVALGLTLLARFEEPASARDDPPKARARPKGKAKSKFDLTTLIALHNKERAKEKLPPLKANAELEAAAKAHAQDMANHHQMQHEGFDGSTPAQRVQKAGYHFQRAGENVAEGQESSAEVMKDWMNSPPHKANILGDFTEIGASMVRDDDGIPFWCVEFGRPWPQLDPKKAGDALIALLNKARADADDTPPLKANEVLTASAQTHADSVAKAGKFVQKDDDGLTLHDRARKAGYSARAQLGESDAMGQTSPEEVAKSWLDSEQSRKVLLKKGFRDVGVGVARTKDGIPCWVVLLGEPAEKE